jgi:phosphocarrier protein
VTSTAPLNVARGQVVIVNRLGLHARAASKLVTLTGRFASEVQLAKDGHSVDAKSIMGVLLLCGTPGSTLVVTATGPDAQAVVDAVVELVAGRFGEPE